MLKKEHLWLASLEIDLENLSQDGGCSPGDRRYRHTLLERPTEKQKRYIFFLLRKAGYDTTWMDASFKRLGAKMRERSGSVEGWIDSMSIGRASDVIDTLLRQIGDD